MEDLIKSTTHSESTLAKATNCSLYLKNTEACFLRSKQVRS